MSTSLVPTQPVADNELIHRMAAAIQQLESLTVGDLAAVRQDAAAVQAAAKQKRARDTEAAAAELRLYAERRLGELRPQEITESVLREYPDSQWRDFRRLAAIPRSFKYPVGAEGSETRNVDLFAEAVGYQLGGRSSTPYSVYLASLYLSTKQHSRYPWLAQTWDKTWVFTYDDPRTRRRRQGLHTGSLEEVLQHRAELAGRVSVNSTALLPIRGRDPLAQVLDSIRRARESLSECWPHLNDAQKRTLDGAYSALDDLATKTVEAVNL